MNDVNVTSRSVTMSPEARRFLRETPNPPSRAVTLEEVLKIRTEARVDPVDAVKNSTLLSMDAIDGVGVETWKAVSNSETVARDDAAILYFYGGGYVMGGPFEDIPIFAPLAAQCGVPVIAPNYRLAPEAPFPAALDDAITAYRWTIDQFGAENIVVVGESAGGNLATVCLLRARGEGLEMPKALALLSPWANLTETNDSRTTHAGLDPTFPIDLSLNNESQVYAGGHDRTDALISPVFNTDWSGFPPTLITTGTRDLLISDCAELSTAMRRGGVDVRLHVWEGMWHVFEYYPDIPEGAESLEDISEFLSRHLR